MVKRILFFVGLIVLLLLLFSSRKPLTPSLEIPKQKPPLATIVLTDKDAAKLVSVEPNATEPERVIVKLPFIGEHSVVSKGFALRVGEKTMTMKLYYNQNGTFMGADYSRLGFTFATDPSRTEGAYGIGGERIRAVPTTPTKVSVVSMLEQIETWPNIDKFQIWRVSLVDLNDPNGREQFIINVWGADAFGSPDYPLPYARYKFNAEGKAEVIDNAAF